MGFSARDICQISGHANEGSLSSYTGKVSDERKQELSDAILHSIGLQPLLTLASATDSNISKVSAPAVSKAPENDTSLDFDVANQDMDLEMSSSQLAFLEEIIEQDVVSANDTNNENSLSVDVMLPIDRNVKSAHYPPQKD